MYVFTDLLFKSMTVFMNDFNTQSYVSLHLECIKEALVKFTKMQLVLNPDKTFLAVHNGVLLGYVVSEKMRKLDPDKITVIDELPTPTNAKDIAKLLGYVGVI